MALTIAWEGTGVIAYCDALSDTAGGTWSEVGGGTIEATTDAFLTGSSCIGGGYSNKSGLQQYQLPSTLNFGTGGSQQGQFFYIWIQTSTIYLHESIANEGMKFRVATDTNNYREYIIAAGDNTNGWTGDWKCFVIDPTKPGSVSDTGTYNSSSVAYIGVWLDITALAKGNNILIDMVAVGKGLRVTGTSTTPWQDIADYCTDYANRAWGAVQQREGIIYVYGKIWFGASSQAAAASFVETASPVVKFGLSEYYYSGGWVLSHPDDYAGIIVEDASGYATTFTDGVVVGTESGRSGGTFIGSDGIKSRFYVSGENLSTAINLYSSSFRTFSGEIDMKPDADHDMFSASFIDCGAVYGQNVDKYNLTIVESDEVGMVLDHYDFNLEDSYFISCPIALDIAFSGEVELSNVKFSGNTIDVRSIAPAEKIWEKTTIGTTSQSSNVNDRMGITFPGPTNPKYLVSSAHWTQKVGSPTGNVWAELYAVSGELQTGTVTGSALAVSETKLATAMPSADYDWVRFVFMDEYQLVSGEKYAIVMAHEGGTATDLVRWEYTDTDEDSRLVYRNKTTHNWSGDSAECLPAKVGQGLLVDVLATAGSNPIEAKSTWKDDASLELPIGITVTTVVVFKLTNLPTGTQVTWVEKDSNPPNQIYEVESVGGDGEAAYSYNWAGDIDVDILILHMDYKYTVLTGFTLTSSNQTIPVNLEDDPIYYNP